MLLLLIEKECNDLWNELWLSAVMKVNCSMAALTNVYSTVYVLGAILDLFATDPVKRSR